MSDLFAQQPDPAADALAALRAAGWRPAGGTIQGEQLWRCPKTGALLGRRDALSRLARLATLELEGAARPAETTPDRKV